MPCQDSQFRRAMRLLAGGVTVIATADGERRCGLTATAVCSLTLAPPRILACVNISGYTFDLLSRSRRASINILASDQAEIADRFAGRTNEIDSESRFAEANWTVSASGTPMLADALVSLDCAVSGISVLDTHAIIIGKVEEVAFGRLRAPLIHFEANYATSLDLGFRTDAAKASQTTVRWP